MRTQSNYREQEALGKPSDHKQIKVNKWLVILQFASQECNSSNNNQNKSNITFKSHCRNFNTGHLA